MNIDLRRLRHFLAVARLGSFSRAAEKLHLTQPALSHSINALEADCGLRFFDRDRSGVRVTPAGQAFLADVEALLGHVGALEDNMRRWGKGETGIVAFGLGPLAASLILPGLLSYLAVHAPGIRPRVSINAAPLLLDDLERGEIEFLVCGENLIDSPSPLDREKLRSVELALLVRAGHPLAERKGVTTADMAAFPLLAGDSRPDAGASTIPDSDGLQVGVVCENYHILKEVMLGSDAIWLSSTDLATREIADGLALPLHLAHDPWPSMPLQLVRVAGRSCGPATTRVLDWIRQRMAPEPMTDCS